MLEVKLHDIGEGMTEGEILHYFVKPGDQVQSDQPLVEVQTDKMTAELPSPGSGVIKEIIINPGATVTVGTTLLIIENDDKRANQQQVEATQSLPTNSNTRILAAPYTRKIAREHGIGLDDVKGTGPGGRIIDDDVYRFIKQKEKQTTIASQVLPSTESNQRKEAVPVKASSIPFKGRRKLIAKKMAQSLYTIPHVTHFEEIDMTELLTLVKELKQLEKPISVPAFFVKAITIALSDFPVFNAKLDEEKERIHLESEYNIGIATDSKDGLIVPVIHQANQKTIKDIHREMKSMIKKAQENSLTSKEISGGTFTISNVGPLGSIGATPIINYPETGLIAFHATKEKPAVVRGEIVIRSIMNISMSFDHRVADGATAVAFTNRFKEMIEYPNLLLLELV
ncbi:2-oxo acid dehydrogenase subunit E2 [Peribacillus cavernae]|uniref:Dihydrolipoamide acetyltransferase component of pyruvate dehydrogenase complex n=1 Tax=Peribacillus cavernae TaxID=1674310 RepID=A0A3S0W9W3_9BACI|nr:dihydrolipoamide acetyltransferase family protein [Peribacillus cavernae]MDQ0218733.1 pyruvate dehydrogenase E2 component (dihydrolipoamide acetyltransferase) [Peribacillus cavernae]RUQ30946.1 2-oxo acid dehydrogenase subunit E2 [Peribacillus cavernae]